jgi:tetratricopeptide (TPR) repeat protein
MGEAEEALVQYLGLLEETRALGALPLTVAVALQASHVLFRAGRYIEAEAPLRGAEAAARECGDLRNLIKVLEAQGSLGRERRDYDEARRRYDSALHTAESLGDAAEIAGALVLAGDLEKARLHLAEALSLYFRAKSTAEQPGAPGGAARADLGGLGAKIDERIRALAAAIGPEAYERVCRKAMSGSGAAA